MFAISRRKKCDTTLFSGFELVYVKKTKPSDGVQINQRPLLWRLIRLMQIVADLKPWIVFGSIRGRPRVSERIHFASQSAFPFFILLLISSSAFVQEDIFELLKRGSPRLRGARPKLLVCSGPRNRDAAPPATAFPTFERCDGLVICYALLDAL